MKIYLETFGCQMNVLDSQLVESRLRALGYTFTPDINQADIILYNTCSVRDRAEQKVWSRLGALKERKSQSPSLLVGVIGCMAQRDGISLMKRMPIVDLMCGPSQLDHLPELLENVIKTGQRQHALSDNTARRPAIIDRARDDAGLESLDLGRSFSPHKQRFQAYVRIVRGCNKFCTYCVVPYTRGPEISRAPQAILEEARKLTDAGCLEITLLGQTVNHYVYTHDTRASTSTGPAPRRTTFAELLRLLHDGLPHLPRLRFLTNYPADFGDDILYVLRDSPRICRYLHIPAQSGSDRILKLMNRGYTRDSYLDLVARARAIVPDVQLAGDFIVGFPTETDEDYALSRSLLETARYKNSFIFQYSPRPGTIGIQRFTDDVPAAVKRFRNNDLLRLQTRIAGELNHQLLGQTVDVLCDGPSGWGGKNAEDRDPDSMVAGQTSANASISSENVQLGPALAAALGHPPPAMRRDRHGNPFVPPTPPPRPHGWVQLTGRTTFDQIVVFDGPPDLAGRILPVRVREAFGMTIFGDQPGDTAA